MSTEPHTLSIPVATLVQHLLFAFLLVVAPIWDYYDTRRLKRNPSSRGKLHGYKKLCLWLWIASLVACLTVDWRSLFIVRPATAEIPWLLSHAWVRYVVEAVLLAFVAGSMLPVGIAMWKKLTRQPRKYASARALEPLSFILPQTWGERRWYTFISITAGICEEILFRGFLLHYLHTSPWTLNLTLALLISAAIFGLQHLYQGPAGSAATALIGLLFGLLFVLTGNLLLPILLHAATDLRILAILPPPPD